jgi:hypothetical protein
MTWLPSASPESTSKYRSPAIPTRIGVNSARPSRTTNTPSVSRRVCPGSSSGGGAAGSGVVRARRSVGGGRTIWPPASYTSSRTATAGIGTASASFRVAVTMSAVAVKPGRTSGTSSSSTTTTLKFVACVVLLLAVFPPAF